MLTKRVKRMITGVSLLLGSSWISYIVSSALGASVIGSIAVCTIVGFIAGMVFMSGCRR